jgi:hypothetical protein
VRTPEISHEARHGPDISCVGARIFSSGVLASGAPDAATRQGKTKLEQETGMVNDRILTVMPNYGTVENARELPPISTKQKYRLATAGVFDYYTFPFIGALIAIDQANNSPASWGQSWGVRQALRRVFRL